MKSRRAVHRDAPRMGAGEGGEAGRGEGGGEGFEKHNYHITMLLSSFVMNPVSKL